MPIAATYTKPPSNENPIQDAAGNESDSFTGFPVTNNVVSLATISSLVVTGPQTMGDLPVNYSIDLDDPTVAWSIRATEPTAAELRAGTGAVDFGTVAMTVGGASIPVALADGINETGMNLYLVTTGSDAVVTATGSVPFDINTTTDPFIAIDALFANSEAGFYIDTTRADGLFTDLGQTTNVTNGQPIASADDGSPNNNVSEQTNAANRPAWDEANKAFNLDGTDDGMPVTGVSGLTTTMTFMAAVRLDSGSTGAFVGSSTAQSSFVKYSQNDPSDPSNNAGFAAVDYYVDGVEIVSCTRADLYTSLSDGQIHIVEFRNLKLDFGDWNNFLIGIRDNVFDPHGGLIGTPVLTSNTDTAKLDAARNALASIYGVTLP